MTDYPINKLDYFCDHTIKRFISQVIRAFSGWQWMDGQGVTHVVPCLGEQRDPLVATLMNKANNNTAATVPAIAVSMTGIEMRREDIQCLTHTSTVQVVERKIENGAYTNEPGRAYMVERLMPRPYALTFDIDVFTSNLDQKLQLLEQMLTVIGVDFQIQNSENGLDQGAITNMELLDIAWSSVSGPVGTQTDLVDYFTLKMRVPIWLNPPAKVTQRKRIEQIVTNVFKGKVNDDGIIEGSKMVEIIETVGNHTVSVENNRVVLRNSKGGLVDDDGKIYDWGLLVREYGSLRPGTSTIHLSQTTDIEDTDSDIVGTIEYDPVDRNAMLFTPNPASIPEDTLPPVAAIIDPRKTFPGSGLPNATVGQRYLLTKSISGPSYAWGPLDAIDNDVIEFDGNQWNVAYRPALGPALVPDHITNVKTGRQLRWSRDGWMFTFDGFYRGGYWRIRI